MEKNRQNILRAIENAVDFLLKARAKDGFWRDFKTLAGESDEWVTAYVCGALARSGIPRGRVEARKALKKLLRRRILSGGWGFNIRVPADADSTVWVLRLAEALGFEPSSWRLQRALRFLERHTSPSGGVATYENSLLIRAFTRLGRDIAFTGWCMPHSCVTAAYAGLGFVQDGRPAEFLRTRQQADGSWAGYWWTDHAYATALACEALSSISHPEHSACLARAGQWSKARLRGSPTSPFATALLLRILLCSENESSATVDHLITRLFLSQQPDGGFESSAVLRIPPPDTSDPDVYSEWKDGAGGGGSSQRDHHRLFTTSTALVALAKSLAAIASRSP